MRCFVGVRFPPEITDRLLRIQQRLRSLDLFVGKYTEPENIHLTLKFLGDIDAAQASWVRAQLDGISTGPFTATFDRLGVFSPKRVRIVWAHLAGPEPLQSAVDEALAKLFDREERFMSHVTLARPKTVHDRQALLNALDGLLEQPFSVNIHAFGLYRSELSASGPTYTLLDEFRL